MTPAVLDINAKDGAEGKLETTRLLSKRKLKSIFESVITRYLVALFWYTD